MTATFTELGIRPELIDILKKNGVIEPTPIQEQVIPVFLSGQDIIAQSQTGTGKTLSFLLPMLEKILPEKPFIQGLIITPTRELALQITKEAEKLAPSMGIDVLSVYGGQDVVRQTRRLKGIPHLIIGTPGRLLDHIRRKTVNFGMLSMLVLDEGDQMVRLGFLEEVEQIIRMTPGNRQTMLLSATMPRGIRSIASHYMRKPTEIRIQSRHVTLDEIEQIAVESSENLKLDALCKMIDATNPYLGIIFCRTKKEAISLNEALILKGYNCDELHGDLSQSKREQILKRFRGAKLQLLVATDIAARGLDIEGVTHVFNYDVPRDAESYIHRIGRTGRAGDRGVAVTFLTPDERTYLGAIEKGINQSVEKRYYKGNEIYKETPKVKKPVRKSRPVSEGDYFKGKTDRPHSSKYERFKGKTKIKKGR